MILQLHGFARMHLDFYASHALLLCVRVHACNYMYVIGPAGEHTHKYKHLKLGS